MLTKRVKDAFNGPKTFYSLQSYKFLRKWLELIEPLECVGQLRLKRLCGFGFIFTATILIPFCMII